MLPRSCVIAAQPLDESRLAAIFEVPQHPVPKPIAMCFTRARVCKRAALACCDKSLNFFGFGPGFRIATASFCWLRKRWRLSFERPASFFANLPTTYQPKRIPELRVTTGNRNRPEATKVRQHRAEVLMVPAQRTRVLHQVEPNAKRTQGVHA